LFEKPATYTVLIKVQMTDPEGYVKYFMLGSQIGVVIDGDSEESSNNINVLTHAIIARLQQYWHQYDGKSIQGIQIMYIVNNSNLIYKVADPKSITIDLNKEETKELIQIGQVRDKFLLLPISFNDAIYGKVINSKICEGGVVKSLMIDEVNFVDCVKRMQKLSKKMFEGFSSDTMFYYSKKKGLSDRIIVVRYTKKEKYEFEKRIDIYTVDGVIIQENIVDKGEGLPLG